MHELYIHVYNYHKELKPFLSKFVFPTTCDWLHEFASFLEVDAIYTNKLLWASKYVQIVVPEYYLFWEVNSCPRERLKGDRELQGTDNVASMQ